MIDKEEWENMPPLEKAYKVATDLQGHFISALNKFSEIDDDRYQLFCDMLEIYIKKSGQLIFSLDQLIATSNEEKDDE